jgi:hypothetical protein
MFQICSSCHTQVCKYTWFQQFLEVLYSHNYQYRVFYIHCSVHHNILLEITNRCISMQWILFLCLVHSTYFGRHTRPSSGVQLYLQPLVQS